ncbi:MAG: DUF2142 domain-containing protein, partial [Chloroflexi bacterium]|nr:DUF2142 domain-containing protein [Chloroflexota bacterium]
MVNERRWLVLIFSLYFIFGVGYSLLMPIWEAPDEATHYHLAWSLARKGEFPPLEKNYEAHQPRAYYYMASTVIRQLDKIDPKLSDYYLPERFRQNLRVPERRYDWNADNYRFLLGVYALRWIGIIFGALALWLIWKAFGYIKNEKRSLPIAALALAALTPQYLHIMASVNNDTLGTLAGALLFYLAVRSLKTKSIVLALLTILVGILFPLTTKIIVLPVGAAVIIVLTWSYLRRGSRKEKFVIIAAIILGVVIISSVIYFIDPQAMQSVWSEISWRLFSFRKDAFTLVALDFILRQIIWTYWGLVGWLAIGLPAWMVVLLTLLGLTGFIFSAHELIKQKSGLQNLEFWITTWLVALLTIAAVVKNGLTTIGSQGRFLFPAIGTISLLMTAGWHYRIPERVQNRLPMIVVTLMVICNLVVWQFGVLPIYY